MKPTRRQFIQSALTSATWLAVGSEAVAETLTDKAVYKVGPVAAGEETSSEWKEAKVSDGSTMRVFVARPKGSKAKMPGVIVLQEVFGVNAYIRDVTQRIADLGYVAAAPELYHRTGAGFESGYEDTTQAMQNMQFMTDEGMEADLKATYSLLAGDPQVDASRIGSVGYCMGGRASFIANAVLPLKAAASYYGARIAPALLPRAKDQHGPILLFWGGEDKHIGVEQPRQVADALRAAGKTFADVTFSDADHGFFCDVRKSYNPVAARESWALFTAFFREHLGS